MSAPYTPYMFSPLTEFLIYFQFMGAVHGVVAVAGLLFALPLLLFKAQLYVVFARGYTVFNLILVCVCAFLNVLWSYTIWGRVYFSTDYVTDFSPFWPITQDYIEAPFGDLVGGILPGFNIWHVRMLWFLFALAAWGVTTFLFLLVRSMWHKESVEQDGCTVHTGARGRASPVT